MPEWCTNLSCVAEPACWLVRATRTYLIDLLLGTISHGHGIPTLTHHCKGFTPAGLSLLRLSDWFYLRLMSWTRLLDFESEPWFDLAALVLSSTFQQPGVSNIALIISLYFPTVSSMLCVWWRADWGGFQTSEDADQRAVGILMRDPPKCDTCHVKLGNSRQLDKLITQHTRIPTKRFPTHGRVTCRFSSDSL